MAVRGEPLRDGQVMGAVSSYMRCAPPCEDATKDRSLLQSMNQEVDLYWSLFCRHLDAGPLSLQDEEEEQRLSQTRGITQRKLELRPPCGESYLNLTISHCIVYKAKTTSGRQIWCKQGPQVSELLCYFRSGFRTNSGSYIRFLFKIRTDRDPSQESVHRLTLGMHPDVLLYR